ncbi:MAG: iron donor protein CyaY [Myxococcaceae bacterium]|jgi:CyaY protein|nr:iron donor protein CyaY [Myxococcaceae bacterium]
MEEAAYSAAVAQVFKKLVAAIDQADPDLVECDATGDMVTITAAKTGEKVVVNTQRAVRQIWVAGKGVGVHFSLGADGRWVDDKQKGLELLGWIDECVGAASGVRLGW